jgi:hypothetical protein
MNSGFERCGKPTTRRHSFRPAAHGHESRPQSGDYDHPLLMPLASAQDAVSRLQSKG